MTSLAHFEKVARAIETPHLAVIDGRLQPSVTGKIFDNVTPRNGTVIHRVAECGAEDVNAAVRARRRAFEDGRWRNQHYKKRVLFALADLIERNTETLAVLESLDVGKPINVWVNGWDACDITMQFGGFKQSGFGRDRSLHALYKCADLKSVSITIR